MTTIDDVTSSSLSIGSPAYEFLLDHKLVVEGGVALGSDNNLGAVYSNVALSQADNFGLIFGIGSNGIGVFFDADAKGSIKNEVGGIITGNGGISSYGTDITITNDGIITANAIAVYSAGNGSYQLTNGGLVNGGQAGIVWQLVDPTGGGGVIENSGTVQGSDDGIVVECQPTVPATTITNHAGGIIKGIAHAIITPDSGAGSLALTNESGGRVVGTIACQAAGQVDTIVNHGIIAAEVHLGPGNDSFNGTGGTSGAVFGEDGDDHLTGGGGKDILIGGLGKDLLGGGAGRDVFDFNLAAESQGANADTIQSFSHAQGDRIDLRTIDATPGGPDNAFLFAGTQSFAAFNATNNGGVVRAVAGVVQVDIGGNGTVDMVIRTPGVTLHAGDFLL